MNEALRKVQKGGDGQGRMVLREGAVQRRGRGTDADATLCAVDKHFAEDEHPDRGPTSFLYPSTLRFSTTTCTLDSCVAATRCISFSSLCYASQYLINCPSQSTSRCIPPLDSLAFLTLSSRSIYLLHEQSILLWIASSASSRSVHGPDMSGSDRSRYRSIDSCSLVHLSGIHQLYAQPPYRPWSSSASTSDFIQNVSVDCNLYRGMNYRVCKPSFLTIFRHQSMTRPDEFEPRRAATYMLLAADLAVEISGLGYHRSPERCKCHIIV